MAEEHLLWHDASTGAATALATHARAVLGSGAVTSGRLCPACGSSDHGRPWLRHAGRPVQVSLSRSGPHLVTAIAARRIGVDVETAVIDVPSGLVHAHGETDDLALAWARKEAILKARGTGLATPMTTVLLAQERWWDVDAPEGYVAALAALPWIRPAGQLRSARSRTTGASGTYVLFGPDSP